jgi:hypothetical protein
MRRVSTWVSPYVLAYLAASGLDLWTTHLALQQPGVSEENIFATDTGAYSVATAWANTAAGGAVLAACVALAAAYAGRVAPHCFGTRSAHLARSTCSPGRRPC